MAKQVQKELRRERSTSQAAGRWNTTATTIWERLSVVDGESTAREQDFVGAWRLLSMEAQSSDGSVTYPLGRDPGGFIIYSSDGYMSVAISGGSRDRFGTEDILAGTEAQLAAAARTYVSYAGPYHVKDGRVYHYVEVSLFPDWVGTTQERIYEFEGARLTLTSDPVQFGGNEMRILLVWERAAASYR